MKIWSTIKQNLTYFLPYLGISILIFPFFRFHAAQDCFSYTAVARKLIDGDISNAINGIWSPLFSWLLLPFISLGIDDLLSVKILQVIIGAFVLYSLIIFIEKFEFNRPTKVPLIYAMIIVIITYAFQTCTPDLLLSFFLVNYLNIIFKPNSMLEIKTFIYLGLNSAFAFLSKSFALPFIVIHLIILFGYQLFQLPRLQKLEFIKKYIICFSIFFLISSLWISIISIKYGYLTYSTASKYNFSIVGPEYNGIHLMRIDKLYTPPQNSNYYWEDPSFLPLKSWNPLESNSNIIYTVKLMSSNFAKLLYYFLTFSPFFILIAFIKVVRKRIIKQNALILIFFSLYCIGYSLLFFEPRFLIIIQLLLIIYSTYLIVYFEDRFREYRLRRIIILVLFSISVTIKPMFSLINYANYGKDVYYLSKEFKKEGTLKGNVVSLTNNPLSFDLEVIYNVTYLTNFKFYGELSNNLNDATLIQELKKYKINFLINWIGNRELSSNNFKLIGKYQLKHNDIWSPAMKSLITKTLGIFSITPFASNYNKTFALYEIK